MSTGQPANEDYPAIRRRRGKSSITLTINFSGVRMACKKWQQINGSAQFFYSTVRPLLLRYAATVFIGQYSMAILFVVNRMTSNISSIYSHFPGFPSPTWKSLVHLHYGYFCRSIKHSIQLGMNSKSFFPPTTINLIFAYYISEMERINFSDFLNLPLDFELNHSRRFVRTELYLSWTAPVWLDECVGVGWTTSK